LKRGSFPERREEGSTKRVGVIEEKGSSFLWSRRTASEGIGQRGDNRLRNEKREKLERCALLTFLLFEDVGRIEESHKVQKSHLP